MTSELPKRVLPKRELPKKALGRSGMEITPVGFGAWAAGGSGWLEGWGPQADADSIAAIHHAVELGINWVDTAPFYGFGHSEEVVRDALRGLPEADRPFVFTKAGLVLDANDRTAGPVESLEPASVRAECEDSLRRLDVERIDLYQYHWPDSVGTPLEDSWAVMLDLIAEGKVRAGGVSNFDVPMLETCDAMGSLSSLQPPFSMIRREVGAEILPWCEAHDVGVIVYSPMQAGLLSGRFSAARLATLADDDWRRADAEFQAPAFDRSIALADSLVPIAAALGVSVAALSIAWTLAWSSVTGAIVGARSPQQIDGWIDAATLTLGPDVLDAVDAAIVATGAGGGPTSVPVRA